MRWAQILFAVVFVVLVLAPLLLRRPADAAAGDQDARLLIVVTPHLAQLREEFARGFGEWHEERYGEPVRVRYVTPGGTSEIIKQLKALYSAAWSAGAIDHETFAAEPGTIPIDLMFGGGSYDHGRLIDDLKVRREGEAELISLPMSVSAGFDQSQLDAWFGENRIGSQPLYDDEQHWLATAVSSFGIVYNRDVYRRLGLEPPASFDDLTDPILMNRVAMADPRQSGSITTTLDYILSHEGWDEGWRLLRELSANARYFSGSSSKPPIDVSAGEAAAGLAIDFYGRGQAQSVLRPGQDPAAGLVGYVDPDGSVFVDPDPVSVLRGGPDPELARRFIEYVLTERGQAVWNFPPRPEQDPPISDEAGHPMGPFVYALRRLPARRVMYERHFDRLVDRVNPYELAGDESPAGWRSSIGPMMGAFGIDTADELKSAWAALNRARSAEGFPSEVLAEMERAFYAMPVHEMPDGRRLLFSPEHYREIRGSWRDAEWGTLSKIRYQSFFREQYRRVVAMERSRSIVGGAVGVPSGAGA
ncbi:MAG: ABC transporter substrate-binding protein [Phycisphaerales bacterium]